jgi:hypothetical protein
MYTILRYSNGRREDGVVLSASPDLMRVILRNQSDTIELRRAFGEWTAEDGCAVELESLVASDDTDFSCYVGQASEMARVAN